MRTYEELFIIKPDAPQEEVDAFVDQIKELIVKHEGIIERADKWGVRKLAYRVQKYDEGLYVLLQFSSSPELVKEIERRMRVTDMVIKFITVRIDEKIKKIEKRRKARDKRAARRPAPPAGALLIPAVRAEPEAAAESPAEPALAGTFGEEIQPSRPFPDPIPPKRR